MATDSAAMSSSCSAPAWRPWLSAEATGELQSITLDEYRAVAETASGMVSGKKGLLFGVGQTLRTAQEQARLARRAGADAVIIMAPYMAD